MQRLFTLGMLCIVVSSGSGCCLLDRIFHSCGERYYNGPPGCQAVPHALCASDHAKCEPCDQYGNWIGTPQWYRPGYQTVGYAEGPGYYQGELLYDGVPGEVIYENTPTPATTQSSSARRTGQPTPARPIPDAKYSGSAPTQSSRR